MDHKNKRISASELKLVRIDAGLSISAAARYVGLHRTSYARQESGHSRVDLSVFIALRALTDLPGVWRGWRLTDRVIISPGGDQYTPGEINALFYYRQIAADASLQRRKKNQRPDKIMALVTDWPTRIK